MLCGGSVDIGDAAAMLGDRPGSGLGNTVYSRRARRRSATPSQRIRSSWTTRWDATIPGAVVIPAAISALSIAARPVTGAEFITAVVLGYEVAKRVMEALGGYWQHNRSGWHSTATCGTFGAAAAVGRILGLKQPDVASALGHAASFSGGLWAFIPMPARQSGFMLGALPKEDLRQPCLPVAASAGQNRYSKTSGALFSTPSPRPATTPHASPTSSATGGSSRLPR